MRESSCAGRSAKTAQACKHTFHLASSCFWLRRVSGSYPAPAWLSHTARQRSPRAFSPLPVDRVPASESRSLTLLSFPTRRSTFCSATSQPRHSAAQLRFPPIPATLGTAMPSLCLWVQVRALQDCCQSKPEEMAELQAQTQPVLLTQHRRPK